MPELTPEQLTTLLAQLDEVVRQARELSAQIKAKMTDERQRDHIAADWSNRRQRSQRRKGLRR